MHEKLKKIFSKIVGIPLSKIKQNTAPENTKKWDSLAHMNILMGMEKEFKIKFTDTEINEMLSFELIEEIIKSKKK